jgi:SHS2 domain-containing protein
MNGFEFSAHAGDARVEVRAESLESLFVTAAQALLHLITEPATIERRRQRSIALEAEDPAELLVRWLNELLFLFETEGLLLRDFSLRIEPGFRLRATGHGEPFAADRHPILAVVKAATYHLLSLTEGSDGFRATVVFDL